MAALERMGFEVTYIRPTSEGYIRPEDVEAAIRPDTALVSIMICLLYTSVPGEYRIYVCGPTVYNYIHIGNARPLIVFDLSLIHI